MHEKLTVLIPLYYAYSGLCFFSVILFLLVSHYGSQFKSTRRYFAGLSLIAMIFMLALDRISVSQDIHTAFQAYKIMYRSADLFFMLYPGFVLCYFGIRKHWPHLLTLAWLVFIPFREFDWYQLDPGQLQLVYIEYPWGEKLSWLAGLPNALIDTRAILAILSSLTGLYLALHGARGKKRKHSAVFLLATLIMLLGQLWDQAISMGVINGLYLGEHAFMAFIAVMVVDLIRDFYHGDQARARLERLSMEMALTEQRQRQELANDLHDGPVQQLSLALLQMDSEQYDKTRTGELVRDATRSIRSVVFRLNPPVLERLGLKEALSQLAEDTENANDVSCEFRCLCQSIEQNKAVTIILYQCVRELVTNAIKHADCRNIEIECSCEENGYLISVVDDGRGFDVDRILSVPAKQTGYGIYSLQQRLLPIGGRLSMTSTEIGTRALIYMPMKYQK